jgi:hypothetical protein
MVLAFSVACVSFYSELAFAQTTAPAEPSQLRMQWMLDTTVGAYEAAGTKNPKWDALARRILEAAGRTWGHSPRLNGDEDAIVMYGSLDAIKAGCRDPLVIYARARSITFYGAKPAELEGLQKGMADAFRASKYPAIRKCFGFLRAAQVDVQAAPGDDKVRAASQALVEEAMALLPEVFADPRMPREQLGGVFGVVDDASEVVEGDRAALHERAVKLMEASSLPRAAVLFARGEMAIHDGWRARGGGFADTVTPDGWRTLQLKMGEGRDLLRQSWELDANDFETAQLQLDAETHDSHGREAMEYWFAIATKLDPDDQRPYAAKLNWLTPKWHGSANEMLAFGRECVGGGRWSGLVPLVLVDAYWELGRESGDGYTPAPPREYFASDPNIWEEIKPIYDRYLQEPDASSYHKTRYAVIAAYSGKWKEANALFKSMHSDHLNPAVLYDNRALDALVKETADESRKLSEANH